MLPDRSLIREFPKHSLSVTGLGLSPSGSQRLDDGVTSPMREPMFGLDRFTNALTKSNHSIAA